ncbi:hypothetical protein E3N88_38764 [Mikania micrantha]|uniref:Uncharacterized protein n=1 Tax=Mikania micrantha TaxID=192012 RepID=A0A5N6LV01_9ASTR|nr:hypothetical protein E3N88_38764 [Mikania micrantha]
MGLLGSSGDLSRYATAHKDTVVIRDKWRGKFERGTSSRYARVILELVALREETQPYLELGKLRELKGEDLPSLSFIFSCSSLTKPAIQESWKLLKHHLSNQRSVGR